jgi:hypothetical protein
MLIKILKPVLTKKIVDSDEIFSLNEGFYQSNIYDDGHIEISLPKGITCFLSISNLEKNIYEHQIQILAI